MTATATTIDEAALHRVQLERQGYFVTPVLFDEATLAGVRAEFERLWREMIEGAKGADALTIEQARTRPFLAPPHKRSAVCEAFCRHPSLLALCRELIGPDADMTWDQAILKPPADPGGDNAFAWHQDMWYALNGSYADNCDRALLEAPDVGFTAWIAITRTTVDNGTLWVLPGRHRDGLRPHVWSNERREWVGDFDTAMRVPAVLEPGQALIMRKYMPHGSGANVSSETRMAYQLGYYPPGLKPDVLPVMRAGTAV